MLGISGGGPYALATGLADQTRVTAVGVAAGVGPWTLIDDPDPDDWERPLLERAEAGDLAGAQAGFAARAAEEFAWLSPGLSDEEVVDGFFGGAPPGAIAWLDDDVPPPVGGGHARTRSPATTGTSATTSPGARRGTSTSAGSRCRASSGTAPRTGWCHPATASGCATSCPMPAWRSVRARGTAR